MTYIFSLDPGKNSGAALGYCDDNTEYRLIRRWQIHGGLEGFAGWCEGDGGQYIRHVDERVVERFILSPDNEFTADLTPKEIEGYLRGVLTADEYAAITWQSRTLKALLTGYPKTATSKAKKQRVRFDFLKRFDLFEPGTDNDDSNDAIVHALVFLKKRRHLPTLRHYWPPRRSTGLIHTESGHQP